MQCCRGRSNCLAVRVSTFTRYTMIVVEYRNQYCTNLYKARPMWDGRDIREEKMFQQAQITKELADEID